MTDIWISPSTQGERLSLSVTPETPHVGTCPPHPRTSKEKTFHPQQNQGPPHFESGVGAGHTDGWWGAGDIEDCWMGCWCCVFIGEKKPTKTSIKAVLANIREWNEVMFNVCF